MAMGVELNVPEFAATKGFNFKQEEVATPDENVVAKITKKYITEKELIKMITQKNKGKNIEESKVLTFIDNLFNYNPINDKILDVILHNILLNH